MSGDVIDKSGESNHKFNMFGGVIESVIGGRAAARAPPAIREYMARSAEYMARSAEYMARSAEYMARSAPQRSSEMS